MKANKNGVKLLAAVAVFAMMFAGVAVVLSDSGESDAAISDTTYISGTITANTNQQYQSGSKVIINGNLTIPDTATLTINGASLTVNEGVTVTIEAGGKLVLNGNAFVKINGSIIADGYALDGSVKKPAIVNNVNTADDTTGVYVYGKIALNKGAVLSGTTNDTTIDGSIVVLAGGSIDVTKKNSNISEIHDQNILIAESVTFALNGYATDVTVTSYTGSDKYYQTSKIGINLSNTVDPIDPKKICDLSITSVVEKTQAKYGSFGADGTFTTATNTDKVTMKNYVLDVSGMIRDANQVSIMAGESVYKASTGDVTGQDYFGLNSKGSPDVTKKIISKATITDELTIDDLGKFAVNENTVLEISGNMTVAFDDDVAASDNRVTISGDMIVSGSMALHWKALSSAGAATGTAKVDGGIITVTEFNPADSKISGFYGAYYEVENRSTSVSTSYFMDLKEAIAGAVEAESDEVFLFAGNYSEDQTTPADALKKGAYIIEDGTIIPDGITLTVKNAIYIPEDATMTFEVGSDFEIASGTYFIFVKGKLVDNDEIIDNYVENGKIYYEVSKYNEDTNVTEYTTLKIALNGADSGDEITLAVGVEIDSDMTIPAGVIVKTRGVNDAIKVLKNYTLTVNGTLFVASGGSITKEIGTGNDKDGKYIVNGTIASVDDTSSYITYVSGAYYSVKYENNPYNLITSAAIAAEKSSKTTAIAFHGEISAGDLTFTKTNEDSLDITINDKFTAGKITLDGASLNIIGNEKKEITAKVVIKVTAGEVIVDLAKVRNVSIDTIAVDDGEAVTTTATIGSYYIVDAMQQIYGTVTVEAGEISIVKNTKFFSAAGDIASAKLAVAEESKIIVDSSAVVTLADHSTMDDLNAAAADVQKYISKNATFIIDGTVDVKKGKIEWGITDVGGLLNVQKSGQIDLTIVCIDGSIVVNKDVTPSNATIEIGMLYGAIDGAIAIGDVVDGSISGFILAYPGSDVSKLSLYVTNDESAAEKTEFFLNGESVFTAYTKPSAEGILVKLETLKKFVDTTGLDTYSAECYSDAALTETVDDLNVDVGTIDALYIEMKPGTINGIISVGTGLNAYIDGISIDNWYNEDYGYYLTIGEHTVTFDVTYGYDKTNAYAKFNGTTLGSDGKFVVTADMTSFTIIVGGAVPAVTPTPEPTPVEPTEKDDSMGLTEYLLIILVILAAILVIVVAVRMMRS